VKPKKSSKKIPKISKSKRSSKSADSEFQSYTYIKNELKRVGWNVNNPNRDNKGQVYTQNECLNNPEIASMFGRQHPEYVIKLNEEYYWIIEAKASLDDKGIAIDEAENYGKSLNDHKFIKALIVTGVAGNDIDKYYIKNEFWNDKKKKYQTITYEGKELTSILDPYTVQSLLQEKNPDLKDFQIPDDELIKTAELINKIFHSASIQKDQRAPVIATMLLSLLGETEPNVNANPDIFIKDINNRAEDALKDKGKKDFFKYIKIELPDEEDAKDKFKEALVKAFFAFRKVNIKSAMRTGSDVLGRFYQVFLSYGNGAKDLGVVLTPRQITEFAVDVLDVDNNDIIYDPTCGTGGFLVSAFYKIKQNFKKQQLDFFRTNRIFGIEQDKIIATLAITNMIFRGDGRNHITNDSCLKRKLISHSIRGKSTAKYVSRKKNEKNNPVTKVLMNPPFALKEKDEKEFKFINHALAQMADKNILFAVLPCATMVKGGSYLKWRRGLLENNSLLSVITFPGNLFYPQSVIPCLAIIVKKGVKHPPELKVLWIKTRNDGFKMSKRKRIKDKKIPNDLEKIKPLVQSFIKNQDLKITGKLEFQRGKKIDFSKSNDVFELIPEAFLGVKTPTEVQVRKGVDTELREFAAHMIKTKQEQGILNQ